MKKKLQAILALSMLSTPLLQSTYVLATEADAAPDTEHVQPEVNPDEDPKPEDNRPETPEDEKPADEKPEDEKPEDEKPADEKPADEKPEDEKPDEPENDKPEEPAEDVKKVIKKEIGETKFFVNDEKPNAETLVKVGDKVAYSNDMTIGNQELLNKIEATLPAGLKDVEVLVEQIDEEGNVVKDITDKGKVEVDGDKRTFVPNDQRDFVAGEDGAIDRFRFTVKGEVENEDVTIEKLAEYTVDVLSGTLENPPAEEPKDEAPKEVQNKVMLAHEILVDGKAVSGVLAKDAKEYDVKYTAVVNGEGDLTVTIPTAKEHHIYLGEEDVTKDAVIKTEGEKTVITLAKELVKEAKDLKVTVLAKGYEAKEHKHDVLVTLGEAKAEESFTVTKEIAETTTVEKEKENTRTIQLGVSLDGKKYSQTVELPNRDTKYAYYAEVNKGAFEGDVTISDTFEAGQNFGIRDVQITAIDKDGHSKILPTTVELETKDPEVKSQEAPKAKKYAFEGAFEGTHDGKQHKVVAHEDHIEVDGAKYYYKEVKESSKHHYDIVWDVERFEKDYGRKVDGPQAIRVALSEDDKSAEIMGYKLTRVAEQKHEEKLPTGVIGQAAFEGGAIELVRSEQGDLTLRIVARGGLEASELGVTVSNVSLAHTSGERLAKYQKDGVVSISNTLYAQDAHGHSESSNTTTVTLKAGDKKVVTPQAPAAPKKVLHATGDFIATNPVLTAIGSMGLIGALGYGVTELKRRFRK